MQRCTESVGRYRVEVEIMHHPEPYHVQIQGHRDIMADVDGKRVIMEVAPFVSTDAAFEGELCKHELQWLMEGIPGKTYPINWNFTVEKVV